MKNVEKKVSKFVTNCQKIVDDFMYEEFPGQKKNLTYKLGRRFAKITCNSMNGKKVGLQIVWAFIDMTNGDVLVPASVSAPAKMARGNLNDENMGLGQVGPYGPTFLTD